MCCFFVVRAEHHMFHFSCSLLGLVCLKKKNSYSKIRQTFDSFCSHVTSQCHCFDKGAVFYLLMGLLIHSHMLWQPFVLLKKGKDGLFCALVCFVHLVLVFPFSSLCLTLLLYVWVSVNYLNCSCCKQQRDLAHKCNTSIFCKSLPADTECNMENALQYPNRPNTCLWQSEFSMHDSLFILDGPNMSLTI